MSTIVEILPCQLGNQPGVRIRLRCGEVEKESKPFLNMEEGGHDFIDELTDRHDVDIIIDKATKPGSEYCFAFSDIKDVIDEVRSEPDGNAEIVPLFPDDGGRPR